MRGSGRCRSGPSARWGYGALRRSAAGSTQPGRVRSRRCCRPSTAACLARGLTPSQPTAGSPPPACVRCPRPSPPGRACRRATPTEERAHVADELLDRPMPARIRPQRASPPTLVPRQRAVYSKQARGTRQGREADRFRLPGLAQRPGIVAGQGPEAGAILIGLSILVPKLAVLVPARTQQVA